jgi:hypothetical protein
MSLSQERFFCVATLNNQSLHLLERHCYQEAFKNLKEAAGPIVAQHCNLSSVQMISLIEKSRLRSHSAQPCQGSRLIIKTVHSEFTEEAAHSVLDDILCSDVMSPIYLEDEWDKGQSPNLLEYANCIILHNIAVACTCLARVTSNGDKAKVIFQNALLYFETAFTKSVALCEKETHRPDSILTTFIIVGQWLHASKLSKLRRSKHIRRHYLLLLEVREIVLETIATQSVCDELTNIRSVAASAA